MTRTPAVINKVKEVFGLNPSKGVNPDEVVGQCPSPVPTALEYG